MIFSVKQFGLPLCNRGNQLATVSETGVIEIWDVSSLPDVSGKPTITPYPTFTPTPTASPHE